MSERWTPDAVMRTIANPVYTGIGPFPPIVTDQEWVAAGLKVIKEIGAKPFLEMVLDNLHDVFPHQEAES